MNDQGPQFRPPRRETPWWQVLLIVLGGIALTGVLGLLVIFGLIAYTCGHH